MSRRIIESKKYFKTLPTLSVSKHVKRIDRDGNEIKQDDLPKQVTNSSGDVVNFSQLLAAQPVNPSTTNIFDFDRVLIYKGPNSVDFIESRRFKAREQLKTATEKEVKKLEKYFNRIVSVEVTFEGKLDKKQATVIVNVPEQTLVATEMADKFEIAVEAAVDKLKKQLKKYKDKLRKR